MPMPPVINPYDPRKKGPTPAAQPAGQQPVQAQPAAPVQSSLPSMQQPQQAPAQQPVAQAGQPQQASQAQQRKPAVPVTYQQQAGAVADPRFSQALAQKLQQDVAAKQAALQQQQAQFQEQLSQAAGGVPAQQRIGDLLSKITSGTASEAELGEYDKLQKLQYQGPTGLQGTANIAALSQLAGSPELLAQQYAGFAPGGVRPGDFAKAMAGLQKSPELTSAQQAATGLAQEAMSAEEIAAQQAGLLKGQTEAAKTQAETAVKAEQEKYMAGLGEEQKSQIESKKAALDKLKEGLFFTGSVSKSELKKLGLDPSDVNQLRAVKLQDVSGFEGIQNISDLDKKIEELDIKKRKGEALTPEQEKLIGISAKLKGISRGADESAALGYAKKTDLSKINALRKLTGLPPIKEEELEKAKDAGLVSKADIASLIGSQKGEMDYGEQKNKLMETRAQDNEILAGNKALTGGLYKFKDELNNPKASQYDLEKKAQEFYKNIKSGKSEIFSGKIANDIKDALVNLQVAGSGEQDPIKAMQAEQKARQNLVKVMNQLIGKYEARGSDIKNQLNTMSSFYKGLRLTD